MFFSTLKGQKSSRKFACFSGSVEALIVLSMASASVSTAYDRFINAGVRGWLDKGPYFLDSFQNEWNWEEDRAREERVTEWVSAGWVTPGARRGEEERSPRPTDRKRGHLEKGGGGVKGNRCTRKAFRLRIAPQRELISFSSRSTTALDPRTTLRRPASAISRGFAYAARLGNAQSRRRQKFLATVCVCACERARARARVCVCACVCKNDSLHWVNTPTLDSCFGLVGHHQQGAECDPVESQPLNIRAYAQPLACGCKLSKITTLACAVTMTTSDHKTREKLLPTAKDSESRTVDLAARTRCVKMTASIGSTLQPWTAVSALWAIISRVLSVIQWRVNLWT